MNNEYQEAIKKNVINLHNSEISLHGSYSQMGLDSVPDCRH